MKKVLIMAAVAVFVIAMGGWANAANEVSVSATVNQKCGTVGLGEIVDFAIDPDGGPYTKNTSDPGNTSPSVKCTKGSPVLVTCAADNGGVLSDGVDLLGDIPFTVSCPVGYTASGFGAADDIDVSVTIAANAAQNAKATAHTGSVTVTVGF